VPSSAADVANTAFAGISALAYARDLGVPNASTFNRESGTAVWSKAFVGARHQQAEGPNLAANTLAYGGAIGIDKFVSADRRVGVFIGAGTGKLKVDLNSQTVDTDYVFGGAYSRAYWNAAFLDVAVTAGRVGGSRDQHQRQQRPDGDSRHRDLPVEQSTHRLPGFAGRPTGA